MVKSRNALGVTVRHFGGFSRATPQRWEFVGRIWVWRPPPGASGNCLEPHMTEPAQKLLDGWRRCECA